MIKVCIYCNRKYPDGNISFHKFPSDKERRQKWLSAMKIPNENIDKNSYLCSEHFAEDTYSCQVINKVVHRFLYIHAVPSIFEKNHRISTGIETDSNKQVEKPKGTQNGIIKMPQQCEDEDEDGYYYKVVNGIIQRYFIEDSKKPVFSSVSYPDQKITENTEVVLEPNIVHVEAPVKVELLPDLQLPIEIRNDEIYSKEDILSFKVDDYQKNEEQKIIFENLKMDAEEIPYEQIDDCLNLNGVNEIEISTCGSQPMDIQQKETSISEKNWVTEASGNRVDKLVEDTEELVDKDTIIRRTRYSSPNSKRKKPNEKSENHTMKAMLYKFLDAKGRSNIDKRLKRYNKQMLSDLLKTSFNYIESLENKLKFTTEQNNQYKLQISHLKDLRNSVSDNETSRNDFV